MRHFSIRLLLTALLFTISYVVSAQTSDQQILIFRNTGEVNLLYTSQIDSITTTCTDTLGTIYDEPIAQVFHAKDTTVYVSIAEIDSVCFGSRNDIEFRNDVHILSKTQDEPWIIRCEGNTIYYKTNTPSDVLPVVGDKLYYPEQTELFPCGLSVKVEKVTKHAAEIAVEVAQANYEEIFSKFFYAGSLDGVKPEVSRASKRAGEVDRAEPIKFTLPLGEYGEFSVDGALVVRGDVVLNVFKHYYHADLEIETNIGTSVKATTRESSEYNFVHNFVDIPLPTVAAVFQPSISIGLFADLNAEMAFNYSMTRKNTTLISWTRDNGQQVFMQKPSMDDGANANQANIDVVLNGSIFAGLQTAVDFALVGDIVGARAKLKYGTELAGELSMGILTGLSREYNASTYGSAEINLTSKLVFEGCALHRESWLWGNVEETKFAEYTIQLSQAKLDLFPHFFQSRATKPQPKAQEVSVATKSNNEIAHDLETGFQVVNKKTKKVVQTTFVEEPVKANETEVQTFTTELELPQTVNTEEIEIRPIFHYAGYTIPYASIGVSENPYIQPVISFGANGTATFVSGTPIVGTKKVGDVVYHIGPYLPVAVYDKDFHQESPYFHEGASFVFDESGSGKDVLVGKWVCNLDDNTKVQLTFNNDGTSSLKENSQPEQKATYSLNSPQSGYITMDFFPENSSTNSLVFILLSVDHSEMKVKFRNTYPKNQQYTFRKQ